MLCMDGCCRTALRLNCLCCRQGTIWRHLHPLANTQVQMGCSLAPAGTGQGRHPPLRPSRPHHQWGCTAVRWGCTAVRWGCTAAKWGCTAGSWASTAVMWGCTAARLGCTGGSWACAHGGGRAGVWGVKSRAQHRARLRSRRRHASSLLMLPLPNMQHRNAGRNAARGSGRLMKAANKRAHE